jgi:hypothetical protein
MGCEKCDVKPCPFCGSGAFFVPEDNEVTCGNCSANNAPEDWDQRVLPAKERAVSVTCPECGNKDHVVRCEVCAQLIDLTRLTE